MRNRTLERSANDAIRSSPEQVISDLVAEIEQLEALSDAAEEAERRRSEEVSDLEQEVATLKERIAELEAEKELNWGE